MNEGLYLGRRRLLTATGAGEFSTPLTYNGSLLSGTTSRLVITVPVTDEVNNLFS